MFRRCRFLIDAFVLIALATPALAAERVERLPAVKPSMAGRFDIALVLNDQPFIVGKGEVASPTRAHFVLRTVPVADLPESTLEVVIFDGKTYTREDANTQWYVQSNADLPVAAPGGSAIDPGIDLSAAPISKIGDKVIAGNPTTQYQIWIGSPNQTTSDHVALDFFIGQQINYLYQYQISAFTSDPDLGTLKLEMVMRLYDFDDPSIVVGPPASAIDAPASNDGLIAPLRQGGFLSTLAAPLATQQLRALAVKRFGR